MRGDIIRAIVAGREAGTRGDPPTTCPYPSTSTLRTAWIRGYAERQPIADQADDEPAD